MNGMEYKNYEEWDADTQNIQADLEDADRKLRQARIDGDDKAAVQWDDEYHRLLKTVSGSHEENAGQVRDTPRTTVKTRSARLLIGPVLFR